MGARGLSKSSVKLAVAPIRELYNHAIDDGHPLQNPAARMGRFLKDKTDRRLKITPLTAEEVQCLLEAAATRAQDSAESPWRDVFPSLWIFLLCAVRTGLRLGEILGLQWGDVDYRGNFIEVRLGFTKRRLNLTKSGKIRRIDMSDQLCHAFQQTKEIREAELAIEGREFYPDEPVFRNSTGHRLDESRVSKTILGRCLDLAGLRHVRFHDLRHTFASLLLANGESLVYVKDQLGHHSIQITVDTYGHLISGSNQAAVNKLDTAPPAHPRGTSSILSSPKLPKKKALAEACGSRTH